MPANIVIQLSSFFIVALEVDWRVDGGGSGETSDGSVCNEEEEDRWSVEMERKRMDCRQGDGKIMANCYLTAGSRKDGEKDAAGDERERERERERDGAAHLLQQSSHLAI